MSDLTKHHRENYGPSYSKRPADPSCCAAYVWSGLFDGQCRNKRQPDTLDGAFCRTHCPDRKRARESRRYAKQIAKWDKEAERRKQAARREALKTEAVSILKAIVNGESHPIEAATEWLARWESDQ